MHPLLHKELTSQIIDQTTSMSSHDRLVSTPDRDLDMIGSAVERIRTARYKQICYDKRKAELINKYRSNTISEDEMEAIFLELMSKMKHENGKYQFVFTLRGVSSKTVDISLNVKIDSTVALQLSYKKRQTEVQMSGEMFPFKLQQACRDLGLKHLKPLGLWNLIVELIPACKLASINPNYRRNIEHACRNITAFEEQNNVGGEYHKFHSIGFVDTTNQISYEEGKKYLLKHPEKIIEAPKQFWKDKKLVYELVKKKVSIITKFPEKKKDLSLLKVALEVSRTAFKGFPRSVYEHDETCQKLFREQVLKDPEWLWYAPRSVQDDKELIIQAILIHKKPNLLRYCSQRLRAEEDVISTALSFGAGCIKYISPSLFHSDKILHLITESIHDEFECSELFEHGYDQLFRYKPLVLKLSQFYPSKVLSRIQKSDIGFFYELFKSVPCILLELGQEFANNSVIQEELKTVLKQYPRLLKYACEETRRDKQLIMHLAAIDETSLQFACNSLLNDQEFMQDLCNCIGYHCLGYATDALRNNEYFFYSLIKLVPKSENWLMHYFNDNYLALSDFPEVVICSDLVWPLLKERLVLMRMFAHRITNIATAMTWIAHEPRLVNHLNASIRSNKDFLIYIAEEFTRKEITYYDRGISSRLLDDEEFLLKMLKINPNIVQKIDRGLLSDKDFSVKAMETVECGKELYSRLPLALKQDRDLVLTIAKRRFLIGMTAAIPDNLAVEYLESGGEYYNIRLQFFDNRQVALAAVKQNGLWLQHFTSMLKSDKEVGMAAIQSNCLSIQYASNELKKDREIMKFVLLENGACAEHVPVYLFNKKLLCDIMENCANNCHLILNYVKPVLRRDRDLIRIAMAKPDSPCLFETYPELARDIDFLVSVIERCDTPTAERVLTNASSTVKKNKHAVLQKKILPGT